MSGLQNVSLLLGRVEGYQYVIISTADCMMKLLVTQICLFYIDCHTSSVTVPEHVEWECYVSLHTPYYLR